MVCSASHCSVVQVTEGTGGYLGLLQGKERYYKALQGTGEHCRVLGYCGVLEDTAGYWEVLQGA